ncbi:unnamed protein product [Symbiodinium microadriaticum]|nr:unnamed protein product [Symbiodinium microadriaticum]
MKTRRTWWPTRRHPNILRCSDGPRFEPPRFGVETSEMTDAELAEDEEMGNLDDVGDYFDEPDQGETTAMAVTVCTTGPYTSKDLGSWIKCRVLQAGYPTVCSNMISEATAEVGTRQRAAQAFQYCSETFLCAWPVSLPRMPQFWIVFAIACLLRNTASGYLPTGRNLVIFLGGRLDTDGVKDGECTYGNFNRASPLKNLPAKQDMEYSVKPAEDKAATAGLTTKAKTESLLKQRRDLNIPVVMEAPIAGSLCADHGLPTPTVPLQVRNSIKEPDQARQLQSRINMAIENQGVSIDLDEVMIREWDRTRQSYLLHRLRADLRHEGDEDHTVDGDCRYKKTVRILDVVNSENVFQAEFAQIKSYFQDLFKGRIKNHFDCHIRKGYDIAESTQTDQLVDAPGENHRIDGG